MSAQLPLPMTPYPEAVAIGAAVALVEDADGGRVFLRGELCMAWDAGDEACRRLAAVQLVRIKAAKAVQVAAGFGVDPETLRRWRHTVRVSGAVGLNPVKSGPKGPSRLTPALVEQIRARREAKASLRAIAAAVGVSTNSVRRALVPEAAPVPDSDENGNDANRIPAGSEPESTTSTAGPAVVSSVGAVLPVLAAPLPRVGERAAARWGLLECAPPVFTPAAQVPLAGLFLALPGIAATGLLESAGQVYGKLPDGFYGLDTMLLEATLRTLVGAARAEAASRIDPVALGRILGLDRAPEVKTIRRKIGQLAADGKATDLLAALASGHLKRLDATDPGLAAVFYVDGHVRAYQGTRRIGKTHSARLRFPAPATVETWVSDAAGDPVLVVMAEPGASLASELRRLLPELREAVGDDRRVLVGFDRGG